MKRIVLALIFVAATLTGAQAQNSGRSAKSIFREFASEKGSERVAISGLICKLAALGNSDEDAEFLRSVDGVYVLDMSDCTENAKLRFRNKIHELNLEGYELMMEASDDEDNVRIYVRLDKDNIKDLLIYSVGDEPCFVNICGNFKMSDIDGLVAYGSDIE